MHMGNDFHPERDAAPLGNRPESGQRKQPKRTEKHISLNSNHLRNTSSDIWEFILAYLLLGRKRFKITDGYVHAF